MYLSTANKVCFIFIWSDELILNHSRGAKTFSHSLEVFPSHGVCVRGERLIVPDCCPLTSGSQTEANFPLANISVRHFLKMFLLLLMFIFNVEHEPPVLSGSRRHSIISTLLR